MEKGNKMYSSEVVDKATSAVAVGFSCDDRTFKESIKELPEEVQAMVLASVYAGHTMIHLKMRKVFSKASEIEKKLKEMENPTKEDADKLLREAFEKADEGKQVILRELSYTSQLNKKVNLSAPSVRFVLLSQFPLKQDNISTPMYLNYTYEIVARFDTQRGNTFLVLYSFE